MIFLLLCIMYVRYQNIEKLVLDIQALRNMYKVAVRRRVVNR